MARARDRYISGLTDYREGRVEAWVEYFAGVAASAAQLASEYLEAVQALTARWRARLAESPGAPRSDAAAWAIVDILPAHPMITAPVAAAATGRSKPQIYQGLRELESAGVLARLSAGKRNRSWEAVGLLDLIARLEAGERP